MPSILSSFVRLAADEGTNNALSKSQNIQLALEDCLEMANGTEKIWAANLISKVNRAIEAIIDGEAVEDLIRRREEGRPDRFV